MFKIFIYVAASVLVVLEIMLIGLALVGINAVVDHPSVEAVIWTAITSVCALAMAWFIPTEVRYALEVDAR